MISLPFLLALAGVVLIGRFLLSQFGNPSFDNVQESGDFDDKPKQIADIVYFGCAFS
jgi:hypothetical protein